VANAKLAQDAGTDDTILWASTSASALARLERRLSEAEAAELKVLLDGPGRFTQAYVDAHAAVLAAQVTLAGAQLYEPGLSYPGTSAFVADDVFQLDSEYVVIQTIETDTAHVGRGVFGSNRAAHAAGVEFLPVAFLSGHPVITVEYVIEGSPITPGIKGDIELPFAGTISAARLLADQAGDIVVDLWKNDYASFPPVAGGTITGGAKPTLSGVDKYEDEVLTGWITSFAAGDVLRVSVDPGATVERVTLSLTCLKS
jgi:hypothetical protein